MSSRAPRFCAPKATAPSISETIAGSLGPRASKSSVTLGKTARDIPRFADIPGNADQDGPGGDLLSVIDRQVGPGGDDIGAELLSLGIDDRNLRRKRAVAGIDDDLLDVTRLLVVDLTIGDILLQVDIPDNPGVVGDDHRIVRIPLIDDLAPGHGGAVTNQHCRAVGHIVLGKDAVVAIEDIHHACPTRDNDARTFIVRHFDHLHAFIR